MTYRFGIFEVDPQAGELRRQGLKVKLQDQPFQVLMMLLECPGEVVTRETLQKKLWPTDTFVDFERGLNRTINKLREALVDEADNPRFIETLPRRGYRFLAPVDGRSQLAIVTPDRPYQEDDPVAAIAVSGRQVLPWVAAGVLAVIGVIGWLRPWQAAPIVADRPFVQLDLDAGPDEVSDVAISRDGARIVFVSEWNRGAVSSVRSGWDAAILH